MRWLWENGKTVEEIASLMGRNPKRVQSVIWGMKSPYIIAELGLNHGGAFHRAHEMIYAAAEAGADAVKFQYVKADQLVSKRAPPYFQQVGEPATSQHEFFSRSDQLNRTDYEELARTAKARGVDFLCTVFDVESVHWIAPLVPAFKVASADITNIPLLEAIASYEKPVYLSTGAATWGEIQGAFNILDQQVREPPSQTIFMHCVLAYPTPVRDAQLGIIKKWDDTLRVDIGRGYSDHTLFNLDVLTTAWLLGATVIEKHFTLDKALPGNDHYHSMDPTDLRALVARFKELQAMIGDGEKRVLPIEEAARLNARQSWHATRDLPAGHVIQEGDIVLKRPGTGMQPSENPVGMQTFIPIGPDEPISIAYLGWPVVEPTA